MTLPSAPTVVEPYEQEMLRGVSARDAARHSKAQADWRRALFHFQQALNVKLTLQAHFELGWAAEMLNFRSEAYGQYSAALAGGKLPARARQQAEEFLDTHRLQMAFVELSGTRGALVYADQRLRARLPEDLPLPVLLGKTTLLLQGPGLPSWQRIVDLKPGQTVKIVGFAPRSLPASQPSPAPTPVTLSPASPSPVATSVALPKLSQEPLVGQEPESLFRLKPTFLWGGLSLAVVGGVTAGVTTLLLKGAQDDLSVACIDANTSPCPRAKLGQQARAQRAANRILTNQNLRRVGAGVAAVGLLTAGIGYLLPSVPESLGSTQAQVFVSSEGTHVQLTGQF